MIYGSKIREKILCSNVHCDNFIMANVKQLLWIWICSADCGQVCFYEEHGVTLDDI